MNDLPSSPTATDLQIDAPPPGTPATGPTSSRALAWLTTDGVDPDEHYRWLVEDANDIVYAHDLEGRFVAVNRAGERVTGYSRDELLRMTITEVVAPEWLPLARQMLARKLSGEERTLYELPIVASDGRRVWLEVSTRLIRREGQPVGVQGIARDISDRKQGEDTLRQSEERFRLLVENSNDGIWLLAADALIFYASRPVTRLLGYALDEVVGHRVFDFVHPDDRERVSWVYASCLDRPGMAQTAEFRFRHKDDRWLHLEAAMVSRLDDPAIGAVVVNYRDISARRRAEQALQESEERFRAVFESALVGVASVDLSGRVIDVNHAVVVMSGLPREELCGRSLSDLAHPDDLDRGRGEFLELVSGQRDSYRAERRYLGKGGRVFWADVSVSLVRDASGAPSFCLSILQNVTERKQAEEELRESNRRLSVWVHELEQRTREIGLLSEMGDMLQACRTVDEAYEVVGPIGVRLFPDAVGCVSATAPNGGLVDTVARWGEERESATFHADDCWALRRGRPHLVDEAASGPLCRHLAGRGLRGALCVPMMAHGELLGVLTLGVHDPGRLDEARRRLAMTVAEHVALAVANLKLRETLQSQSIRDPLTGLFNRRYMEESLERELRRARRGGHTVGVIMLDLDHFKPLNDTWGHAAGDEMLRAAAGVLQRSIRAEDIACRYGGEEFVLILPEVTLDDAASRAESIRQSARALRVPFHRQVIGPLTLSAGVAVFPDHGPSADALLRAADAALYEAKARGRDRVAVNRAGGLFGESIVDYQTGQT